MRSLRVEYWLSSNYPKQVNATLVAVTCTVQLLMCSHSPPSLSQWTKQNRRKSSEIYIPQTLQTLNVCGSELSKNTSCLQHALMGRKNLRTLTISISRSTIEDMKILTQLTFLIHLSMNIILDSSGLSDNNGLVDKSTMLLIVNQLQHFPHLESFALTVVNSSFRWSDYDKQMILSKIFDISPARNIRLTQCGVLALLNIKLTIPFSRYDTAWMSCILAPPQLNEIFIRHSLELFIG